MTLEDIGRWARCQGSPVTAEDAFDHVAQVLCAANFELGMEQGWNVYWANEQLALMAAQDRRIDRLRRAAVRMRRQRNTERYEKEFYGECMDEVRTVCRTINPDKAHCFIDDDIASALRTLQNQLARARELQAGAEDAASRAIARAAKAQSDTEYNRRSMGFYITRAEQERDEERERADRAEAANKVHVDHVNAVIAERDRLEAEVVEVSKTSDHYFKLLHEAWNDRDAAQQDLADVQKDFDEVSTDRDRLQRELDEARKEAEVFRSQVVEWDAKLTESVKAHAQYRLKAKMYDMRAGPEALAAAEKERDALQAEVERLKIAHAPHGPPGQACCLELRGIAERAERRAESLRAAIQPDDQLSDVPSLLDFAANRLGTYGESVVEGFRSASRGLRAALTQDDAERNK
jgi:chromosome segregation ATPase